MIVHFVNNNDSSYIMFPNPKPAICTFTNKIELVLLFGFILGCIMGYSQSYVQVVAIDGWYPQRLNN